MIREQKIHDEKTCKERVIDNGLIYAMKAAKSKAKYDICAKQIIGHKIILAHILVKVIDEFKGMNPKDVVSYIEGTPYISEVPIESGLTNTSYNGQKIIGFNTENAEINEGVIRFDIVFYVYLKDGLNKIILNVELQKDEPEEYNIVNRAVFYVSRLISSQKERDFIKSKYDDIKQVYSIWICMNMNENSINNIYLVEKKILGKKVWNKKMDLFNISLIGITKKLPEAGEKYKLHRLLGILFSDELLLDEKMSIIESEYDIILRNEVEREVNLMCNLAQGIEDRGIEKGILIGEARGEARGETNAINRIIENMQELGYTMEQILSVTKIEKIGDGDL